jgi:hypothetical protein
MKTSNTIQIKVITPTGQKVTVSERICSTSLNPILSAFYSYREKHKKNFASGSEFRLIGEGVW